MKKTLIAVAAAAALTTSAFAEITFGTWMRVVAAPVASDGDENYTGITNSWGGGARTARLDVNGVSEDGKAGFCVQFFGDPWSGSYSTGDQGFLWVKPIDQIKVSMGDFDHNALRGDMCYGSWNWIRPSNWLQDDEGLTFDGQGGKGLLAEVTPIDNLYAYAFVPLSTDFSVTAEDTYKSINVAAAYTIDGIGKIKAGFFGGYDKNEAEAVKNTYGWANKSVTKDGKTTYSFDANVAKDETETKDGVTTVTFEKPKWELLSEGKEAVKKSEKIGDFEAAFDLTAVENLYVTAGFKYRLADKEYWAAKASEKGAKARDNYNMKVALGASYQVADNVKVSASGAVFMYDIEDVDVDPKFQLGAGVDVGVADGLNLTADVRYISETKVEDKGLEDDAVSFLIGITKNVSSNGYLGVGFQGSTNGNGFLGSGLQYEDKFAWAIPVALSVWF